jgi:hypothetical protein
MEAEKGVQRIAIREFARSHRVDYYENWSVPEATQLLRYGSWQTVPARLVRSGYEIWKRSAHKRLSEFPSHAAPPSGRCALPPRRQASPARMHTHGGLHDGARAPVRPASRTRSRLPPHHRRPWPPLRLPEARQGSDRQSLDSHGDQLQCSVCLPRSNLGVALSSARRRRRPGCLQPRARPARALDVPGETWPYPARETFRASFPTDAIVG